MPDEATPTPVRPRRADRRVLRKLREPIPAHNISKKPRVYCWECIHAAEERPGHACEDHTIRWCDTCRSSVSNAHEHDDYVGHAEVVDRLLEADLLWTWEAFALDERGLPALDDAGGLWIWLTVGGVKRPAYGHANGKTGPAAVAEAISSALKSGSMRFGVALDQRAQTDLHAKVADEDEEQDAGAAPIEPQHADPAWIARVGSLLARKRGAYGEDRPRVLSEILRCEVTDVAELSPEEARRAVRILSGGPDLSPPTPAARADDAEPGPAAEPPAEPAPTIAEAPAPLERRAVTPKRRKPAAADVAPAPAAPGPDAAQLRTINSLLNSRGVGEEDTALRLTIVSRAVKRRVESLDELSPAEAKNLILGLGSGEVAVDSAPATAEPDRGTFDGLLAQIRQAITDEDAGAIKVEIGKALTAELITKADCGVLYNHLDARGRQVGLAGAS